MGTKNDAVWPSGEGKFEAIRRGKGGEQGNNLLRLLISWNLFFKDDEIKYTNHGAHLSASGACHAHHIPSAKRDWNGSPLDRSWNLVSHIQNSTQNLFREAETLKPALVRGFALASFHGPNSELTP